MWIMTRLKFLTFLLAYGMFTTNVTALILQCTFSQGFQVIGGLYYCRVSNLKTTSHTEIVTGSVGTHQQGFNNDGVKALDIIGQICNFLPKNINETFANIEGLQVHVSNLQHITKNNLRAFPKLRGLWVRDNALSVLEHDLFLYNRNLEVLDVEGNKIIQIDSNLLEPLPKLSYFSLKFNYCINKLAVNRAEVEQLPFTFKNDCQDETIIAIRRL